MTPQIPLNSNNFFCKLFLLGLPWFIIPNYGRMTIPLGSLLLSLALLYEFLFFRKITLGNDKKIPVRKLLILFWFYCLFNSIVSYSNLSSANFDVLHLTDKDINYYAVALARLIQIILVFVSFEYMRLSKINAIDAMSWWLKGMLTSLTYHLYLYGFTSDELLQRGGTFLEGNFAGLYYLLSFFIALQLYNFRANFFVFLTIILSLVGIILTKSTAAILSLFLALLVREIFYPGKAIVKIKRILICFVVTGSIITALNFTILEGSISEKISGQESNEYTFSRVDRIASFNVAIELFNKSPLIGTGLQSYGFLIEEVPEEIKFVNYDYSFRRISNNVYAEILAELGLLGIILFVYLITRLLRLIRINNAHNYCAAFFGVLIYWLAFPTFSMLYVWCFFGLASSPSSSAKKIK